MKHININAIFFCLLTGLFIVSCEKTEIQKSSVNNNEKITSRGDECEECPIDDCCCGVWLDNDQGAMLTFCGTSSGMGLCFGGSDCGASFSGGGDGTTLSTGFPKFGFCMDEASPFWIHNSSATDDADLFLTCQGDITFPQILQIHLGPGETLYYETDGSCDILGCDP